MVKEAGYYFAITNGDLMNVKCFGIIQIIKNATDVMAQGCNDVVSDMTTALCISISNLVYLEIGDFLEVYVTCMNMTPAELASGSGGNFLSVHRVP